MAYPSRATLVGASSVDALTGLASAQQDTLRAMAIAAVEGYCGQRFDLEEDLTLVMDGSGKRELPLTRRLASLTSLTSIGSSLTGSDVAINDRHDALYVSPDASFNWYEKAIRDDQPPLFASGIGAVSITGDWGFSDAELPATDATTRIAMAMRIDMEEQALAMVAGLSETSRAFVKLRVSNLSEGPMNYGVDQSALGLSPDVMMLLEPYVWKGLGVLV